MKDPIKIYCNLFGLGQQLFEWIITGRKKSLRQQGDWLQSDKEISALYLSANTAAKKKRMRNPIDGACEVAYGSESYLNQDFANCPQQIVHKEWHYLMKEYQVCLLRRKFWKGAIHKWRLQDLGYFLTPLPLWHHQ